MGDGEETVRKTKTVSIDPSTLVVGSSRGSKRSKSNCGGVMDGTRRTTISRRSRSEAKAEVEAKSAAVQEAVMKALMTQPAPPPPPTPLSGADADAHDSTSSTHTVSLNSSASKQSPIPGPRSVNAVQNALNDLNRLIEDRARERARKTIRAERRRGEPAYAPSPVALATPPSPRNVTPLEPNSTAACDNRHSPPWGCLKGGHLPTFREHMRTQRARRKQHQQISKSNTNSSLAENTPRVRIQTPKEAARASSRTIDPTDSDDTTSPTNTLADTVITVGRKDNGRVAFVVGGRGTRRADRSNHGQRSVTNRAKLRKARLLKGGNKAPQRLVDVIAESVDIIGDVVRPHEGNSISMQT